MIIISTVQPYIVQLVVTFTTGILVLSGMSLS